MSRAATLLIGATFCATGGYQMARGSWALGAWLYFCGSFLIVSAMR